MILHQFLKKLRSNPYKVEFSETVSLIDSLYNFTPTAFKNGTLNNEAGQNPGSCKIFAFARLYLLTREETLACFGKYYFEEVLKNPEGTNHQNIRNFMKYGWEGIVFEQSPLQPK